MFEFDYVWPYVGLGAAGVLVILLFATRALQGEAHRGRWNDIAWLTWLATCAYMLHQFEEYAIDATGAHYAFRGALCAQLGFSDAATCPVPTVFFTAVNVGTVWLAGIASALLARRWPAIGISFAGIPFANIFAHLGPAIAHGSYNPGLVTALAVFAPLSTWVLSVARTRAGLGWRVVVAAVVGGIAVHGVLLGSIQAYVSGLIGVDILVLIQILNAGAPALIMVLALRL